MVPKFEGRIFQGEKILSTPSFGGEVKPSVPCRRFTACKRFLNATWTSGISGKIHRPFLAHIVPPLATRISGETTSGEKLERLKIIRFSSTSNCQDLLKMTGGESLNIKGSTISHTTAVHPGH